jgi:hypothetical protein
MNRNCKNGGLRISTKSSLIRERERERSFASSDHVHQKKQNKNVRIFWFSCNQSKMKEGRMYKSFDQNKKLLLLALYPLAAKFPPSI